MKKKLSVYYDVSGQGEYDNWSYCADNDMWYEDKKEVLPIPKAQTEFIKDLTCQIKVDYILYIDQDWSKIEHNNHLEQYAEFISRKNNGTNAITSAILLKTPKQECPICISQEGLWYLNCFLKQT